MTALRTEPMPWMNSSTLDVNYWFPSTYNRGPTWLVWLGISSSFIAIFIKLWTPISINRIPEALYTLPFFYILYKHFGSLIKDRVIQLFFIALFWPIVAFGILYLQDPDMALKYQKLDNLARLFLFVPIAWWLGGNARTLAWYLVTAFAGLLVACLFDPNLPTTLKALAQGKRVDFNILNAQHVALYFSIALVGLLSTASVVFGSIRSIRDAWKPILWAIGLMICGAVVLGTQTRAAWLALIVCTILWAILIAWKYRFKKPGGRFFASVLTLAFISGLVAYQFSDTVIGRVQSEQGTLAHIAKGDWDSIPYTSIGVRLNTWIEATQWIVDRPITGWGGDVRKDVIDQADQFPSWVKEHFGHFHNSYFEFTLAYGLVAPLIIVWLFLHLLWRGALKPRTTRNNDWRATFTLYSLTVFVVMNLFESYMFFWSGIYVITAILVVPYGLVLSFCTKRGPNSSNTLLNESR